MDRRGFLKVLGVGGVAVVAAPQLVLPKARPSAGGDARIFVPPAGGWLPNETALSFIQRADIEYGGLPSINGQLFREHLDVEWSGCDETIRPGDVVRLKSDRLGTAAIVWVTEVSWDTFAGHTVRAIGVDPTMEQPAEIKTIEPIRWSARRSLEPLVPRDWLRV